jgi:hypothetical protein
MAFAVHLQNCLSDMHASAEALEKLSAVKSLYWKGSWHTASQSCGALLHYSVFVNGNGAKFAPDKFRL